MADYHALHRRSIEDPEGFWREQAALVDWIRTPTRVLDPDRPPFYRWFPDGTPQHLLQRARPARRGRARRPGRADLRQPGHRVPAELHLRRARGEGGDVRRRAARLRRRGRRPGGHLPADDPGGRRRDAGVRPDRRRPLRGVRRLRPPGARRPDRRRPAQGGRHRVVRHRADPGRRVQADGRPGARPRRARPGRGGGQAAAAGRGEHGRGPRPRLGPRHASRAHRAGRVRRGRGHRPALRPLHLRHHRQAQGHRPRQRRPRGRDGLVPAQRLRRAPGPGLVGRLRRRLGRRPLLHRLRAADLRAPPRCSTRASPWARRTRAPSGG